MKILAFTDPHGDPAMAEAVARAAAQEKPDLIVCPGDLSLFDQVEPGFFDTLRNIGRPIYFAPGNHDSDEFCSRITAEWPFLIDVSYRTLDAGPSFATRGLLLRRASPAILMGIPGRMDFEPGREAAPETVEGLWSPQEGKPVVTLSHYPPTDCALDGGEATDDAGGSALVRLVLQKIKPDLAVCGHYHQAFGRSGRLGPTLLMNPGPAGRILDLPCLADIH